MIDLSAIGEDGLPPESDAANGRRIAYHLSDVLRWREGWQVYRGGLFTHDEASAVSMVTYSLWRWIASEARNLETEGADEATVRRRRAWAEQCTDMTRVDAAMRAARGLVSVAGRPVEEDEWPASGQPTAKEQVLTAAVAVLGEPGAADLRAYGGTGRVVVSRLVEAIATRAPRFWPAAGEPPMSADAMERLLSKALGGRVELASAGATRNTRMQVGKAA